MFGFGNAVKKIQNAAKYKGNLDVLEGIVASAVLVAYADNSLDSKEEQEAIEAIQNNKSVVEAGFTPVDVANCWTKFVNKRPGSFSGKVQLRREIEEAVSRAGGVAVSEDIFLVAADVAMADGDIGDAEKKELAQIAKVVGIDPSKYGL